MNHSNGYIYYFLITAKYIFEVIYKTGSEV